MKKGICLLLALGLLTGCSAPAAQPDQPQVQQSQIPQTPPAQTAPAETGAPQVDYLALFSDRDYRTTYDSHATITLSGNTATSSSGTVRMEGSTIIIEGDGTYVLSGDFTGMVMVDANKKDKVQLVLKSANITNPNGAALYVRQADKVFITLEGKSTLTAGETFTQIDDNNIDGALFSKDDLTINGNGNLEIQSPAGHGIVCKDSLHITGGTYTITTAEHGIDANDEVCMDGGNFTLTTGKDGVHCENGEDANLGYVYSRNGNINILCEGDGISASAWFYAQDSSIAIIAGGGSKNGNKQTSDNWGGFGGGRPGGMPGSRPQGGRPGSTSTQQTTDSTSIKGIKAGTWLTIGGGQFALDCADDGLHSNGGMDITSGTASILSGDDGVHAEQTLTITGGSILVKESYEALEALHVKIYGGNLELHASDDGINAAGGTDGSGMGGRDQWGGRGGPGGFGGGGNGSILIAGGEISITASGDALDANGTLEITGGKTLLCGPTRGDTAVLDYDRTGTINGGEIFGTGSTMMAQSLASSNQGVIFLKISNMPANTNITISDSDGNVIFTHAPALDFALLIYSSPNIKKGGTYTVSIGATSQQMQVTAG